MRKFSGQWPPDSQHGSEFLLPVPLKQRRQQPELQPVQEGSGAWGLTAIILRPLWQSGSFLHYCHWITNVSSTADTLISAQFNQRTKSECEPDETRWWSSSFWLAECETFYSAEKSPASKRSIPARSLLQCVCSSAHIEQEAGVKQWRPPGGRCLQLTVHLNIKKRNFPACVKYRCILRSMKRIKIWCGRRNEICVCESFAVNFWKFSTKEWI